MTSTRGASGGDAGPSHSRIVGREAGVTNCFDISPDGERGAAGYEDGSVRVFDLASGEVLSTRTVAGSDILVVRFSPDGSRLAASSLFDEVIMLESNTLDDVWRVKEEGTASGPMVFSGDSLVCSTHDDDGVSTRNAVTGELTARVASNTYCVVAADGRVFAEYLDLSSVRVASVTTGETLHVFASSVEPATQDLGPLTKERLDDMGRRVHSFRLSDDGGYAAIITCANMLTVCDLSTGRSAFSREMMTTDCFHFLPGRRFVWTPDRTCEMELRDLESRCRGARFKRDDLDMVFPTGLFVSPDGTVAVVRALLCDLSKAGEYRARAWDLESGTCLFTEPGIDVSHEFLFSRDGRRALSGKRDGLIRVWTITGE